MNDPYPQPTFRVIAGYVVDMKTKRRILDARHLKPGDRDLIAAKLDAERQLQGDAA